MEHASSLQRGRGRLEGGDTAAGQVDGAPRALGFVWQFHDARADVVVFDGDGLRRSGATVDVEDDERPPPATLGLDRLDLFPRFERDDALAADRSRSGGAFGGVVVDEVRVTPEPVQRPAGCGACPA